VNLICFSLVIFILVPFDEAIISLVEFSKTLASSRICSTFPVAFIAKENDRIGGMMNLDHHYADYVVFTISLDLEMSTCRRDSSRGRLLDSYVQSHQAYSIPLIANCATVKTPITPLTIADVNTENVVFPLASSLIRRETSDARRSKSRYMAEKKNKLRNEKRKRKRKGRGDREFLISRHFNMQICRISFSLFCEILKIAMTTSPETSHCCCIIARTIKLQTYPEDVES